MQPHGEEAPPQAAADPATTDALDALAAARDTATQAVRAAMAAWAVFRAELRLAQASAVRIVVFGLLALVLAGSAWLAVLATIAVALCELTGRPLAGVGTVALANVVAVAWMALWLRRCARDLALPHTRSILAELSDEGP